MSDEQPTMTDLFGPVIYSYTRAQALDDGQLVDVTDMARQAGFKYPTAITNTVHVMCTVPKSNHFQTYNGRLWDVLFLASLAARGAGKRGENRAYFKVKIGRRSPMLIIHVGPGDDAEPVITIMDPSDD